MGKKTKKKRIVRTSTKVVIAAITAIILFWLSEIYLLVAVQTGFPDMFIRSWFFFWSVELVSLAGIKITKVRKSPYEETLEDEEFPKDDEIFG